MGLVESKGKGHFLDIKSDTVVRISDTTFNGGLASEGGAIYLDDESSLYIQDSIFSNNIATLNGGAIQASYSSLI